MSLFPAFVFLKTYDDSLRQGDFGLNFIKVWLSLCKKWDNSRSKELGGVQLRVAVTHSNHLCIRTIL